MRCRSCSPAHRAASASCCYRRDVGATSPDLPPAVALALSRLASGHGHVRAAAARELGALGDARAVPRLREVATRDTFGTVALWAALSAAALENAPVEPPLASLRPGRSSSYRAHAAALAAAMEFPRARASAPYWERRLQADRLRPELAPLAQAARAELDPAGLASIAAQAETRQTRVRPPPPPPPQLLAGGRLSRPLNESEVAPLLRALLVAIGEQSPLGPPVAEHEELPPQHVGGRSERITTRWRAGALHAVAITDSYEHPHEGGGASTSVTIELAGGVMLALAPGLERLRVAAPPAAQAPIEARLREALAALGG